MHRLLLLMYTNTCKREKKHPFRHKDVFVLSKYFIKKLNIIVDGSYFRYMDLSAFFNAFNVITVAPITPMPNKISVKGIIANVVADAIYPNAN